MRQIDESTKIAELVQRLTETYAAVPGVDVAKIVDDELRQFQGSLIREYVPLFVERRAHAKLKAGA